MKIYTAIYNGTIINQTARLQDLFDSEDYMFARDYFENVFSSSDTETGYICTYKVDDYKIECWRV